MTRALSGYFGNSIVAWRDELVKRRRQLEARQKTLDKISHPCAADQRALTVVNEALIRAIDREYKKALNWRALDLPSPPDGWRAG